MKPSARSAIRSDVLTDYEVPSPDLVVRVLRAIPGSARMPASHRGRVAMQTAAVVLAALLIGAATVGVRVSRGEMALPVGLPFGGLHPPAAGYSIVDEQFVSADTGWIVAQLYVHNGPTVVMHTTDGGKTWHEQFRIPDGSGIGSFRFWNALDGDLVEDVPSTLPPSKIPGAPGSSNMVPRTYRTHDGGARWSLVDLPIDWSNPGGPDFALTQLEAWRIVGRELSRGKQTLQHTVDGGDHWTTVGFLPAEASFESSLTFTDSRTGWLAAYQSKNYAWDGTGKPLPVTNPTALLWVTRDGGNTWSAVDLPLPSEAAANNVGLVSPVFFGKDGLLEFGVIGPPPTFQSDPSRPRTTKGWTHSYILTTHDGGQHWTNLIQTPGGLQQGGAFFFDVSHWLTSNGPDLSETYDGGKTWTTRQVLANGLEFDLAPWNYIDAKTIWSQVGADKLVRSTDGGATWTAVMPPSIK